MKLLTLSIEGINGNNEAIQVPRQIDNIMGGVGINGVHIFQLITDLLILAAVLLCLFTVIYGGWLWMTSEGDKKKIEDARNTLVYAVIGLIVVALAFFFISVLSTFFGVPLLKIAG